MNSNFIEIIFLFQKVNSNFIEINPIFLFIKINSNFILIKSWPNFDKLLIFSSISRTLLSKRSMSRALPWPRGRTRSPRRRTTTTRTITKTTMMTGPTTTTMMTTGPRTWAPKPSPRGNTSTESMSMFETGFWYLVHKKSNWITATHGYPGCLISSYSVTGRRTNWGTKRIGDFLAVEGVSWPWC